MQVILITTISHAERVVSRKTGLTVCVALIATFVVYADVAILNIAAPVIERKLGASVADLELMVAGYQISFAAMLVTGGRLADILGCRVMFVASFGGFVLTSAACGLAASPGQLIAFRVLQGVTAAALSPQVVAIIQVVLPAERRAGAFAALGTVISAGTVAGPLIAGALVSANIFGSSWRPIFLINVPIGLVAMGFGVRLIPGMRVDRVQRIDYGGALLLMITLVALMAPLTLGPFTGWPAWTWISLVAVIPLGAAFLWSQRRLSELRRDPMLPAELWRDSAFRTGMILYAVVFSGVIAFFLYLGITLQTGLHITPIRQAIFTSPFAVALALVSAFSGRFVRRLGGPSTLIWGSVIAGAGFLSFVLPVVLISGQSLVPWTIPSQLIAGGGLGLVIAPLLGVVLTEIRSSEAGAASGLLSTAQVIGGALGVGLMGLLFSSQLPAARVTSGDLRTGLALALLVNPLAFGLAALVVATRLRPAARAATPTEGAS